MSVFFIFPEMPKNKFLYDAGGYYYLSLDIENWGQFYSSIRTFGYPFFLYLVRQLAIATNTFPWLTFLFIVQFSIHTLTSFLTLGIYNHLLIKTQKQASPAWGFLIFALSQLNLVLLPFAFEILTENLSIFLFTLAIYWFTSENKHRFVFMGFALGLATLIRPFYGPLSLICGFALVLFVLRPQNFTWSFLKRSVSPVLQFGLPFLIICSPQIYLIHKHENRFSLVGESAHHAGKAHLNLGQIVMKFETHGLDKAKPLIVYLDTDRQKDLLNLSIRSSPLTFFFSRFGDSMDLILHKTIALFQNFEWSVFRTGGAPNPLHPVFIFGFVHFSFLFWILMYLLPGLKTWFQRNEGSVPVFSFVGTSLLLHLFLYSVPTVPESRYIAPVLPGLIALGCCALRNLSKPQRTIALLLAAFTYFYTFHTLRASIQQLDFTELYNLVTPKT